MTDKQHKHADVIKAWADGAEIEFKTSEGIWCDSFSPVWSNTLEYRVKPKPNKHQDVIDAYNRGEQCQFYSKHKNKWEDFVKGHIPGWYDSRQYRVKPKEETIKISKPQSAPVVIDTTAGWSCNSVDVTVNGVQIEGVVRADWNFQAGQLHDLVLYINGAQTKGGAK